MVLKKVPPRTLLIGSLSRMHYFNIPFQLIHLLQIEFQAQKVLFLAETDELKDGQVNHLITYHHEYHAWMSDSTNELKKFYHPSFYQQSLVICPEVSQCLNFMESLSLTDRMSIAFLAHY